MDEKEFARTIATAILDHAEHVTTGADFAEIVALAVTAISIGTLELDVVAREDGKLVASFKTGEPADLGITRNH